MITIRIWEGCKVRQVITLTPNSSSSFSNTGGAENSTKVDIELDPWFGYIVDHRAQYPSPVAISGDMHIDKSESSDHSEP